MTTIVPSCPKICIRKQARVKPDDALDLARASLASSASAVFRPSGPGEEVLARAYGRFRRVVVLRSSGDDSDRFDLGRPHHLAVVVEDEPGPERYEKSQSGRFSRANKAKSRALSP